MNPPTPQDLALFVLDRGQANLVDAIIHFGRNSASPKQWQSLFSRCVKLGMLKLVRRGQIGSAAGPSVYAPTTKLRSIALSIPTREQMAAAFSVPVSIFPTRPPKPGRYYWVTGHQEIDTREIPETSLCAMEAGGGFYVGPIPDETTNEKGESSELQKGDEALAQSKEAQAYSI